jgi:hypothetical protein
MQRLLTALGVAVCLSVVNTAGAQVPPGQPGEPGVTPPDNSGGRGKPHRHHHHGGRGLSKPHAEPGSPGPVTPPEQPGVPGPVTTPEKNP